MKSASSWEVVRDQQGLFVVCQCEGSQPRIGGFHKFGISTYEDRILISQRQHLPVERQQRIGIVFLLIHARFSR